MEKINLKEQILKLKELQVVDKEIYGLLEEKGRLPEEIAAKDTAFEEKKKPLLAIEEELKDLLKQKKDKELELGSKEESIKKLQSQLYSLKTNKEYTAMLSEIEAAKADKSVLEDKILLILEGFDRIRQEEAKEKEKFAQEESAYKEEKKKIEDRIKEIEQRLAVLEAQRANLSQGIDKKILSQYERILKNRQGLALVAVRNNSCQGCFMNVTHQVVNEIKMYDKIVTCGACQRILYLEDEP
ncbi:MAG: C4-type zinc ribbon domain-containing protein [Candidatus Omnitrophica bacterium]|nr:C4-type zinc ribbon domain-containing protein [Candidatus Omnitrophota bacterium]